MVARQIARRGVQDAGVLRALREVPREAFVPEAYREHAYADEPLPIGEGQTISQPYVVALMLEAAELKPDDRLLDVGAGSGYAAAVASRIVAEVHAVELLPALAEGARKRFAQLDYDNVSLHVGDGAEGWPEAAPFDAILVAAGAEEVPQPLKDQLALGGRLIIPVGAAWTPQVLRKITRRGETEFEEWGVGGVSFVPLVSDRT